MVFRFPPDTTKRLNNLSVKASGDIDLTEGNSKSSRVHGGSSNTSTEGESSH